MAEKKKGLTRLHELEAAEVSLVPKGANRRRFLIFKSAVEKDELTAEERKHIADDNFALPKERKYPIADISHARNALARASGKPEESKVKAAVYRKYPSLKPDKAEKADMADKGKDDGKEPAKKADDKKPDPKGDKKKESDRVEAEASAKDLQDKIKKADPKMMQRVEECMKKFQALPVKKADGTEGVNAELGMDCQAAMKSVARILSAVKGKVPPALVHQIADIVGYSVPGPAPGAMNTGDGRQYADDEPDGDEMGVAKAFEAIPEKTEDVKKDDMDGAKEAAHKAYKDHMEKLGYRKYPDAEMAMKTKDGSPVRKSVEGSVTDSANGAPDLSAVDPKTRQVLEGVFKAQKDLIAKNAELEAKLTAVGVESRKKEIVQKAASFSHLGLPTENIVTQLEAADKAGKEVFELVCKNFEQLNEQGRTSKLFAEVGYTSQGASEGSANAWAKIEKMAEGVVAKSADGMTSAQAIEKVLQSPEGQRLYKEYQSSRPGGI